jgi:flagellar biosynthesis protein FliR
MARHTAVAGGILAGSLLLGVLGYHFFDELRWIDALVDAAMLLGGMGPVSPIRTTSGKLFAAFFALYAGLIFLVAAGVLLAPVAHRLLHHFHLEDEGKRGNGG